MIFNGVIIEVNEKTFIARMEDEEGREELWEIPINKVDENDQKLIEEGIQVRLNETLEIIDQGVWTQEEIDQAKLMANKAGGSGAQRHSGVEIAEALKTSLTSR